MRLRGGFRRHRLRALRLLLVTILVNALRYGDDVVCAAEARAFQGARLSARPLEPCSPVSSSSFWTGGRDDLLQHRSDGISGIYIPTKE